MDHPSFKLGGLRMPVIRSNLCFSSPESPRGFYIKSLQSKGSGYSSLSRDEVSLRTY